MEPTTRSPTRTPTTRPATGTPTRTATRTATGTQRPPTSTRSVSTRTGTPSASTAVTTTTATISPTATPDSSGGLAPGAIGGIAGGAVALVALVGVIFYKRRKRAGAASKDKEEPIYMHASNYSNNNHTKPPPNNGISGPLALSAEADLGVAPPPFGQPLPPSKRSQEVDKRAASNTDPWNNNNSSNTNQTDNWYNNNSGSRSPHDDKTHLQSDYYDDVQDYYDGPQEPIGAQRPAVSPRDVTHGNLTPAPEYYLGKEDIDPKRDLRGLDSPETYIRKANEMNQTAKVDEKARHRRSSVSSDGGSAYMTLEQAQQAHQKKMQGHKESIGSVAMLIDTSNKNKQPYRSEELRSPGTPNMAHDNASIAISDSSMSMMPSLPPVNSPMPFSNNKNIPGHKDSDPLSPGGHDDPYAESAFSEDFSSYPNSPHHPAPYKGPHPSHQQPYPSSRSQSPFPPGPYGPGGYPQQGGNGYRGNGYGPGPGYPGSPPYNGYGGGGRPQRGPGGYPGYGPSSHGWNGPGYGPGPGGRGPPPNYGPQHGYNGYPPQGAGPGPGGYRQHPSQQRDPYYNNAY
ncbi:hypothetical protein FBU30_000530 [Linnemannia zychae]|nr:hypothetical protein FBU30_000530 [Linnemannia zychae]